MQINSYIDSTLCKWFGNFYSKY